MRRKAIIIVGCQHRLSSSVVRCAETFLSVCLCDITFYCWCSAGGHFSLYIFFCHSAPARYSLDGRADTAAIPRQYDKRNISGCLDESEFLFLVWLWHISCCGCFCFVDLLRSVITCLWGHIWGFWGSTFRSCNMRWVGMSDILCVYWIDERSNNTDDSMRWNRWWDGCCWDVDIFRTIPSMAKWIAHSVISLCLLMHAIYVFILRAQFVEKPQYLTITVFHHQRIANGLRMNFHRRTL